MPKFRYFCIRNQAHYILQNVRGDVLQNFPSNGKTEPMRHPNAQEQLLLVHPNMRKLQLHSRKRDAGSAPSLLMSIEISINLQTTSH